MYFVGLLSQAPVRAIIGMPRVEKRKGPAVVTDRRAFPDRKSERRGS
jgi:hypothetical protein